MRWLKQVLLKYRTLLENFGYLSVLQGLTLVFQFVTYPYLIRVLSPEVYGKVVFANGISAIFTVVINFGFQASATREVALNVDNPDELSNIYSSVLQAKVMLWLVCGGILAGLIGFLPRFNDDPVLFALAFGTTFQTLLFPQWYFQGIEKLKYVTVVFFTIQVVSAAAMFGFIHTPEHYLRLPAITGSGALLGGVIAVAIARRHGIRIRLQPWKRVAATMRSSAPLFFGHAAAAVADRGSTVVVGVALGNAQLAQYNLAERVVNIVTSVYFNMGRTLYPNLAKSQDKAFSRRATKIVVLAGLAGTLALMAAAGLITQVLGGAKMEGAVPILRVLAPYVFLGAMGPLLANVLMIEKKYNALLANSVVSGVSYLALLLAIEATGHLTVLTVGLAFLTSVAVRATHRYAVIRKHGLAGWLHQVREAEAADANDG